MRYRVYADSTRIIRHARMSELNTRPFCVSAIHYLECYRNQPRSAGTTRAVARSARCVWTRSLTGPRWKLNRWMYMTIHGVCVCVCVCIYNIAQYGVHWKNKVFLRITFWCGLMVCVTHYPNPHCNLNIDPVRDQIDFIHPK
jgi:hypothetical protein